MNSLQRILSSFLYLLTSLLEADEGLRVSGQIYHLLRAVGCVPLLNLDLIETCPDCP